MSEKIVVSISVDSDLWDALRMVTTAKGATMSGYVSALLKGVLRYEIQKLLEESENTQTISRTAWTEADAKAANSLMKIINAKPRYRVR